MRCDRVLSGVFLVFVLYTPLFHAQPPQSSPDRLAGYWNIAEGKKKQWQDLDRQFTQMFAGPRVCDNYAEVHEKLEQVLVASDTRIAALQAYYRANSDLHQRLLNAAREEVAGSESRQHHLKELDDLENKYLEELEKRRADLANGIDAAGDESAKNGRRALQTLDELIKGAKNRQRIREETVTQAEDNRRINLDLERQAALLLELAKKHGDTVDLEDAMWKTYYRARSSRLTLKCGPNSGMRDPGTVFPHKKP